VGADNLDRRPGDADFVGSKDLEGGLFGREASCQPGRIAGRVGDLGRGVNPVQIVLTMIFQCFLDGADAHQVDADPKRHVIGTTGRASASNWWRYSLIP